MLKSLSYQLNNTCFTFDGLVFNQTCGIPMGIDDDPEFATLNLHQLEYHYLNELTNVNIHQASIVNFSFIFKDDISSLNSNDYILDHAIEIYGHSVLLNKENTD